MKGQMLKNTEGGSVVHSSKLLEPRVQFTAKVKEQLCFDMRQELIHFREDWFEDGKPNKHAKEALDAYEGFLCKGEETDFIQRYDDIGIMCGTSGELLLRLVEGNWVVVAQYVRYRS